MRELSIGRVAQKVGLRASAIRYYESEGLIPKARRRSGRRVYDDGILDHLAFIRCAKRSGFRIPEIRALVSGLTRESEPGERWRAVAEDKFFELDKQIETLKAKKRVLQQLVKCRCPSLEHFGMDLRKSAKRG